MGLSLKKITGSIRDIFDANTASDIAKRGGQTYQQQAQTRGGLGGTYARAQVANQNINNSLTNGRLQQAVPMAVKKMSSNPVGNYLLGGNTGTARSLGGIAQDVSGFADLVTPGLGTNRFTQGMERFNKGVDNFAQTNNINKFQYKAGQAATDLATFAVPGGLMSKGITKVAPGLAKAGTLGRVTAKALPTVANVGTDIVQGVSRRTAKEQDNNLGTLGMDTAMSLGTAGLLYGGGKLAGKVIKNAPKVASKVGQALETPTKRIDDLIIQNQKAWDVETNPTRRKQISQGISDLIAERRSISEGGYIKNPLAKDPLESLKQEARKYGSAEEFVAAQQRLLHGSRENIDQFDLNHLNATYMHDGLGVNFTDNQDFAKLYSRGKNQWGEINKIDDGKGVINERFMPNTKALDLTSGDMVVKDVLSFDDFKTLAKEGRDKDWARKNLERNARNRLMGATDDSRIVTQKVASMSDDELLKVAYDGLGSRSLKSGDGLPDLFRQLIDVYGITDADKADVVRQFAKVTGTDYIKSAKKNGSVVYTVLNPDKLKTKQQLTDLYNQATKNKLGLTPLNQGGYIRNLLANDAPQGKTRTYKTSVGDSISDLPTEVISTDGGYIRILKDSPYAPDNRTSIVKVMTDEGSRRQGVGSDLVQQAIDKHGNISAFAENEASQRMFYKKGLRPLDEPNASLERTLAIGKEQGGGVTMVNDIKSAPQVGKTDPNNWRNAVDGQKFGKDPDTNANILSDKQSTMREIARVSRSDKELSDILDRAEALKKDGYLGDNANLAWDVQNNPGASGATKARASKLYKEITAPQGKTLDLGGDFTVKMSSKGNIYIKMPNGEVVTKVPKTIQGDLYAKAQGEILTPDRAKVLDDWIGKNTQQTTSPKPKVAVRNQELDNLSSDSVIRQMASIIGEDVGQSNTKLGVANQAISSLTGGKYTNTRGLNPFRAVADSAGGKINNVSEKAITGKGSKVSNASRSVFAGAGLADETKQIGRIKQGILANTNDLISRTKKQISDKISAIEGSTEALDRVMRDNKYIKRVYGDTATKLSPDSLTPELRAVHDQLISINKLVNDINYKTGVIGKEQWMGGRKGSHIARIFDIPKDEKIVLRETLGQMFENSPGIKRKDISKMTDDVIALLDKDPAQAILIRQELALRNLAVSESMDAYATRGFIKKYAPNDNYVKVTGKKYGKYDGQYIERGVAEELGNTRIFDNQLAQSFSDLATKYRGSALGVTDSLIKSFKTAGTPGTILGNVMSNIVAFTPGAGTNPIYQAFDMIDASRKMSKGLSNADVFEARQLGVIGGDTAKQMIGDKSVTTTLANPSKNLFKRVHNRMGQFYGAIDDAAKLGLFTRLKKQGLDPQTAALEVAKFTQDYNNVGRVITLIADTPVLGKPFARFAPELVRIVKNNVTRSPHTVVASLALLAAIGNEASKASNESDEDRKARETSVGETQIPGTKWINQLIGGPDRDISLNIAMGDSAVNIARSVGLNFPVEPGGDANTALLESLLPVEVPTRKNELGETVFDPTKIVTSMTVRPLVEQALDRNFMGGRVTDPANRQYDSQGNEMKYTELPADQQRRNRGAALFTALAPAGSEIDSIGSSIMGRPSVTGKERSLKDSLLRGVGIKVTGNDSEARKKRTDIQEYYATDKKDEQDFLRANKDLESEYFKIFPKTKDRETGLKVNDQISPEKWTRIKSEERIFDFMKRQAMDRSQKDGAPVDPIFKLPTKGQEKILLDLRSRPTGEDIESEEILRATQSWYPEFEKAERDYNVKNSEYFKKLGLPETRNPRAKAYSDVALAVQPDLVKQYYQLKTTDPEAAKELFKTTDLNGAFDAYTADRLRYINDKRKIEGFPPISATTFDNVTFGYEEDEGKVFNELKYGKGYGGFGGGKKSDPSLNPLKYAVSTKSTAKGPTINLKTGGAGRRVTLKAPTGSPKVSIRKSKV